MGVFYGSMALRRLGVDVAVATRLHPRDYPRLDEMRRAGVRVFPTAAEATSGIENIYSSENMERRVCHPLAFAGAFQPEDVPDIAAKVIMISPIIAGEVDLPCSRPWRTAPRWPSTCRGLCASPMGTVWSSAPGRIWRKA